MHGHLGLHRAYIRDGIPLRIGRPAIAPVQVPVMSRVYARILRGSNRYGPRSDNRAGGRNEGARGACAPAVAPSANNIFMARRVGKMYTRRKARDSFDRCRPFEV